MDEGDQKKVPLSQLLYSFLSAVGKAHFPTLDLIRRCYGG